MNSREARRRRSILNKTEIVTPLAVFIVTLSVYLRTMAPTIYTIDSAELTTAAYALGIIHPPGHPTALLLGKLFTYLPVGDVGYRVNLMSAFFGAVTVTCVYLICRRLSCSLTASVASALLLAFSYFFWAGSVVAEVYTLNAVFLTVLIVLMLLWRQLRSPRLLFALAFLYGLSFGSHTGAVLFAPGIAAFLLLNRSNKDPVIWPALGMLLSFLLGLSVFAYLPIRYAGGALNLAGWFDGSGKYHTADLTTWEGLRWFVSGDLFRSKMFAYDAPGLMGEGLQYLGWLWQAFVGVGIVLGAVGFVDLIRTRPRDAFVMGLFFVAPLLFYLDYAVLDKESMFLPTYVIWSLWAGAGCDVILREFDRLSAPASRLSGYAQVLTRICLVAMPLMVMTLNYQYTDVSWDNRWRNRAAHILEATDRNAMVLGYWNDVQPMLYLQKVEGLRPDVLILNRTGMRPEELEKLVSGRMGVTPIYSVNLDPSLNAAYHFEPLDPGYRLMVRDSSR